jgi:predicted  nucleic acid-binding Zn-ribbon protein
MFRCLECGEDFEKPLEVEEAHDEIWHLCPHCKENNFKPFVKDYVDRKETLEKLCEALACLNRFESRVTDALNSNALNDTEFYYGRSELYETICLVAGDSEFDLPSDIAIVLSEMKTDSQVFEAMQILTKNIE